MQANPLCERLVASGSRNAKSMRAAFRLAFQLPVNLPEVLLQAGVLARLALAIPFAKTRMIHLDEMAEGDEEEGPMMGCQHSARHRHCRHRGENYRD